jgi:DNA helicase-2/ATP-dependent DNA helicase PcrA
MYKFIDEQIVVYQSESMRILLLGGPGTGKTAVMACCVIKHANNLVQVGIPEVATNAKVLVVSLTNFAAGNIHKKIQKLLKAENVEREFGLIRRKKALLDRISCSTFHSFSLRMLRHFSSTNSFNDLTVVDNESNEEILQKVLADLQPEWKDDMVVKKQLLNFYLKQRLGKYIPAVVAKYPRHQKKAKLIAEILEHLEQTKRQGGLITFDDMVIRFHQLLKDSKIRERIQKMFPVILVDEFQDTTGIQFKVLKKIVGPKTHLLCAGDDGQTIYTWNGASFRRVKHFKNRFPEHEIFTLTTNHRSGRRRLTDLSNALLAQSKFATQKRVTAKKKGRRPRVVCNEKPLKNYKFIIKEIEHLEKKGISLNRIAVIYRFRSDAVGFRDFLAQHKKPYKIYWAKNKRNRPIIKLVFALIRIIESLSFHEDAWRVVLLFHTGVGKRWTPAIIEWLKNKNPADTVYPQQYRFTPHLQQLLEFVNGIKDQKLTNQEKLQRIFDYALRLPKVNASIDDHIKPTLFWHAAKSDSLSEIIDKYTDRSFPLLYSWEDQLPFSDSHITLSTIHGIKGGEFHTVFFLGTGDHFFKKHGLFASRKKREGELQALNVAVTRAKRRLYLLFPIDLKTWKEQTAVPNTWRFLKQVDGKLLKIQDK